MQRTWSYILLLIVPGLNILRINGKFVWADLFTSDLADACRQYRDVAGFPEDAALLGMFLDSGETELVVGGLEALQAACEAEGFKVSGGLRSQIRMLAEDPDDEVAELAEALAARL